MRYRTLEIRWHDSKPISSCDFQPVPFKKARPPQGGDVRAFASQAYRLATAGEDNHVRVWMVHPNIRPRELEADAAAAGEKPRPARVEYLATLSRHSAAVNVVRFSPNGELIASAGDDGMVIIWAPSATPQTSTYGSDLSPDDLQHEKEYWKPRTTFRCTTMQVYDLAWSPTGEFLLAGSTDNCARVFAAADGKCMHEIAEHSHYVQGVAWDPLNEYIATQSSDRSMHVYRINASKGPGTFEAHAVGRNTRLPHSHHHGRDRAHSRTPSREMPGTPASMAMGMPPTPSSSAVASGSNHNNNNNNNSSTSGSASASASMFPPPPAGPSSRRSSFSGSNAPSSPSGFSAVSGFSRYGRSPSPMPALPAIRTPPSAGAGWAGRYEERTRSRDRFSNFFRRLAFSPDGALLLTPAGTFEDPSARTSAAGASALPANDTPSRGRKARPVISTLALGGDAPASSAFTAIAPGTAANAAPGEHSNSSVYIYSRANFARPPVAQLPGHKKASVAVRFSPVLFELRAGVGGGAAAAASAPTSQQGGRSQSAAAGEPRMGTGTATGEEGEQPRDVEESMEVDLVGPLATPNVGQIAAPAPQHASFNVLASPALSPIDRRPPTPAASKPGTPAPGHSSATPHSLSTTPAAGAGTGSVFALPYRMLYAVVTMDTVAIYDTQQAGPVCLLTKLHYDEFTDLTWSPDGQCLMLASRDGYCTLITFDEILPTHHTQQAALQLQQIAAVHSVPISYAPSHGASGSVSGSQGASGSAGRKRPLEPLTPAASVDGDREPVWPTGGMSASTSGASVSSMDTEAGAAAGASTASTGGEDPDRPPKKKRRVALTRVGDL
ncbi:WD40-repeat-containing domain protein [Mycena vitilis]|nr:WD40-repeat-containing domain protein [Mycena vitilis]